MHITMASVHKPKTHDAPNPRGAETADEQHGSEATPSPTAPAASVPVEAAEAPAEMAEAPAPAEMAEPAEATAELAEAPAPPAATETKTATRKTTQKKPAAEPVTSGE